MERKRGNYIAHWRRAKNISQTEMAEKLAEYAAAHPGEALPTTAASLSRIESGEQNFKDNLLEAIAHILEMERRGDLLDRNPFAGSAEVISFIDRLDRDQQKRAAEVLQAIFGSNAG